MARNGSHQRQDSTASPDRALASHKIRVMQFSGAATFARPERMTLPDLADEISLTKTESKKPMPCLSLYDNGEVEVAGINAKINETDIGQVCKRFKKAKIRALIYDGPHNLIAAPQLQAVIPFSTPLSSEQLPAMAARLNGLLKEKLSGKSFNPEALLPYGAVGDQQIKTEIVDGDFIDQRDDLDAGAIDYNPDIDLDGVDLDSQGVKQLNADHAVLPIGGKTRVVTFGELEEFPGRQSIVMTQSLGDFASLQNKYRHEYMDAKGEKKTIPLGSYWIDSRYRRQYDGGMAFMPHKRDDKKLNLWRGYGVKPVKPEGKSGAAGCAKFLDFMLKVICSGNERHFDYLRKREATILQRLVRSEIALGLYSEQEGVGKGFYETVMRHLVGNHGMAITHPRHIVGNFNPHLETLLRLTADEALFVGNHEHRNMLFALITEPTITIEHKGCAVYSVDNYLNISMLSNSRHFFPASGTARRVFIPTTSADHMQDFKFFAAIDNQLRNDGGFEALLYHLLHEIDLTDFNVRAVPKTAGLAEQAALGRRGVDGLVEEACSMGRVPAAHWNKPGWTVTSGKELGYGLFLYIDSHRDKELVNLGAHKVIRRLVAEWGCQALGPTRDPTRDNKERRRSMLQWPTLEDLRTKFVERFGDQKWLSPDDVSEWTVTGSEQPGEPVDLYESVADLINRAKPGEPPF
ncbi:hypothetical protein GWG65_03505 [Bradyrhizobium sp. CSA207]|uniref:primase-helicase family protein n=1 Tax=Bradyrhizobium sp. CSA207 TaxID=2698826 RepID=UPI0023B0D534|nr:primase-helicase family protein [Bradyrhizobium sp. CSA207]MDE5440530.1 hypothetical protein [Bradyrhizobium sp. CSA207]